MQTFVRNRVIKITDATDKSMWAHVSSSENPSDILSRGVTVSDMKDNSLWWNGPPWLRNGTFTPVESSEAEMDLPEMRKLAVSLVVTQPTTQILGKYSSFAKVCRVIAYCRRFLNNARSRVHKVENRTVSPAKTPRTSAVAVGVEEIQSAETIVVRWIQQDGFEQEIQLLREKRNLPRKSPLRSLNPFIDGNGLLRVGGRLQFAAIPEEQKHQILLPANHHMTAAIMREQHISMRHCPPEQLLHEMRQRYWPVSGRREAKKLLRECFQCFRFRPLRPDVIMGQLPEERVTAYTRPFTNSSVDYAGPMTVRESRRRGRVHTTRGYVAVFTCLSTKAVHLEFVSDLTTEAFLAALGRFTARRGICNQIFSDCGTNFVGAANELKRLQEFLAEEEPEITTFLAKLKIVWRFCPARSPHFNGLAEAAVKVMKRNLYIETQGRALTFEEYYTLLCDIEAIMNSRPLTPLTNDPSDLQVLTPAHLLFGDSLLQPVQQDLHQVPENRLSRWQTLQKLRQRIWQRWQSEYLQELQRRNKWNTPGASIKVDSIVLLVDDNTSPLSWPRGRVIQVHPGTDGEIRVVTVKTQFGTYRRAVKKVCPLPLEG